MSKNTLFNIPMKEVHRQLQVNSKVYDCDKDLPISTIKSETLEPCIRGAKKISENPETKSMVKEVLLSSRKK